MSNTEQEAIGPSLLEAAKKGDEIRVRELLAHENAIHLRYVNYQTRSGLTPLLIASCFGHSKVVQLLLERGAEVDMVGIDEMTALSAASESGHHETVEILGKAGANVEHISHRRQFTPLMLASRHGHTDTVKVLLELKANVNNLTTDLTALMCASKAGHTEVVKLLLPHVSKICIDAGSGFSGLTPLMFASANGHADIAKLILERDKSQVNQRCCNGYTSLLLASYYGHHEVAKVLIKHGANLDMRTTNGTSALIEACSHVHVQFVKILLDHNAEVNLSLYKDQCTALMIACTCVQTSLRLEIVKLLLRENTEDCNEAVVHKQSPKADVNLRDFRGRTALTFACEYGDENTVQLLVKCGADVNPPSKAYMSPLQCATRRGHTGIVQVLLESGANPNPLEEYRNGYNEIPPLIVATLSENMGIVQLLLSHNANVNVEYPLDRSMQATPLMLAIMAGCHELVKLFVEHGADVQKCCKKKRESVGFHDNDSPTLIHLADACGDTKIIDILQSASVNTTVVSTENDTIVVVNSVHEDQVPALAIKSQPKRRISRLYSFEDSNEESSRRLLICIEEKRRSLDSHCPQYRDCPVPKLFPSDNYTTLLKKLSHYSRINQPPFPTSVPPPPTVTVNSAYEVLLPVAADWMCIGTLLGIATSKLDNIEAEKKKSVHSLLSMIKEWFKRTTPAPGWNKLVEAVEPFNQSVAKEIQQKYCPT